MCFTIIIASCNRPDRLARALQAVAVAVGTHDPRDRIVVADNGTTRSAADVVAAFAAASGCDAQLVRCAPFDKAAALNAAIREARTEWLAFTDDDCLPDAHWLSAAAAYAGAAGLNLFSGQLAAGPVDFTLPRWLRHPPHSIIDWSPAFVDFAPLPTSGVLAPDARVPFGANLFVRKSVFERHGGYDEALWARCGAAALGSEDAEFAMRVRARGEAIGYCAAALVVHPVYPERTTLRYYLRHIHHAGMREPFFTAPGTAAPTAYLMKSMIVSLSKCAGWAIRGRSARAVRDLMNACRDAGELRGWRRLRKGVSLT